jgi:hypothetical protein
LGKNRKRLGVKRLIGDDIRNKKHHMLYKPCGVCSTLSGAVQVRT